MSISKSIKASIISIIIIFIIIGCGKNRLDETYVRSEKMPTSLSIQVEWPELPSNLNTAPPEYLNISTIEVVLIDNNNLEKIYEEESQHYDAPDELSFEEFAQNFILELLLTDTFDDVDDSDTDDIDTDESLYEFDYMYKSFDVTEESQHRDGAVIEKIDTGNYSLFISGLDKDEINQINLYYLKSHLTVDEGKTTVISIDSDDWFHYNYYMLFASPEPENAGSIDYHEYNEEIPFKAGDEVNMQALAEPGYKFNEWSGDIDSIISGSTDTEKITVKFPMSNLHINANFLLDETQFFNLSLNKNEDFGLVNGGGDFNINDTTTISAEPYTDYAFIEWTGDIDKLTDFNPYSMLEQEIIMPGQDIQLEANFGHVDNYITLTADPAEGAAALYGEAGYITGQTVEVMAEPAVGYYFLDWYKTDGTHVSSENPYIFNMPNNDYELVAKFAENEHVLTYQMGGEGTIIQNETVNYNGDVMNYHYDETYEFAAEPAVGYNFVEWQASGFDIPAGEETNPVITLTMPDNNSTLYAVFEIDPDALICVVEADANELVKLPFNGTKLVDINWGDGTNVTSVVENYPENTYADAGEYTVLVTGTAQLFGNEIPDSQPEWSENIKEIISFGNLGVESFKLLFANAVNNIIIPNNPDTIPDSVLDMTGMFAYANSFNQDISSWDVSNVLNMSGMFHSAQDFKQNISSWDISNVQSMDEMFKNVTLPFEFYNEMLIKWADLPSVQNELNLDGGNSRYSYAKEARDTLEISYGWTITDGGPDFNGGTGTLDTPYLIANARQLNNVRYFYEDAVYFELNNDIDFISDETLDDFNYDYSLGWEPIGSETEPFNAVFNGNEKVIRNLKIDDESLNNAGLFGVFNGTISKMGLAQANINAGDNVGALAGKIMDINEIDNNNYINEIFISGNVRGNSYVGGLAGKTNIVYINNIYSVAKVVATNQIAGGLIGGATETTIENSYAGAKISAPNTYNGITGEDDGFGFINYTYFDIAVAGEVTDIGTGQEKTTGELLATSVSDMGSIYEYWDNTIWSRDPHTYPYFSWQTSDFPKVFDEGDGDVTPYGISNPLQLHLVRFFPYADFEQTGNINLDHFQLLQEPWYDSNKGWRGIEYFQGHFNGNNYTIDNMFIERFSGDSAEVGLFSYISMATLENINISNADLKGDNNVGGLVSEAVNSNIINCSFDGIINAGDFVGGIVGNLNETNIKQSYATANVNGELQVGGLVGKSGINSEILNSYAHGDVSGNDLVGGLVGKNPTYSIVENCYSVGHVTSVNNLVGGLIGENDNTDDVIQSFYDSQTSGQNDTSKGIPKTTAEMKNKDTFTPEWDFDGPDFIWEIDDGNSYPFLTWEQ
ncbi:MAG: InlB B-repeat-containing protein [Candidatus Muiribacteriota bacterium]